MLNVCGALLAHTMLQFSSADTLSVGFLYVFLLIMLSFT